MTTPPYSTFQLSLGTGEKVFEGYALSLYGPALSQNATMKVQLLHADLVAKDG